MEALCRAPQREGRMRDWGGEKVGGKVKGDLISTLLGLRKWVWNGGERMNGCETAGARVCRFSFKSK